MTDAVAERASTNAPHASDPHASVPHALSPSTLHQTFLDIAEHLHETGDFNERAYLAMCNVAKEAHSVRDDAIGVLNEQLETMQTRVRELISEQKQAVESVTIQTSEAKRVLERARRLKAHAMKQVALARQQIAEAEARILPYVHIVNRCAPTHLKMQQLVGAIQKNSVRQLRSGRRY